MKENEKNRLTVRVEPEVSEEIMRHLKKGDSKSVNRFLNEAIRHYLDYLDLERVRALNGITSVDKYMRDREYKEAGADEWLD